MNRYQINFNISEEIAGLMIREYLLEHAKLSNRLLIRAKQDDGAILVNGMKKTVRYVLQEGDELQVIFPPEAISPFLKRENIPLDIVYEDDDILVVNKPANMSTMPSRTHPTGTLANGILHYYYEKNISYTIHVVTRLDTDTSGLVLVAKHQYSHSFLSHMQQDNKIERKYRAIVHGVVDEADGLIDKPIGRHPDSIIKRMVRADGQTARTFYSVDKTKQDLTYLHVQLETGRTHQIRVHFASIGHPLVGDTLYGGSRGKISRQALHCSEISFIHPFTKKALHIQAEIPADMLF